MIKSRFTVILTAILMTAAAVFLVFVMVNPDAVAAIGKKNSLPYEKSMDKLQIMSVEVIVDEAAWQNMLDNAIGEEYIMADVIINGVKVKNVGIRPKGNSSLSSVAADPNSDRYSFKIEFDHYIKNQTWLGLDKLALNNMHSDASYMKEYLSYDILNYIGVDTPMYAYADISVNGTSWGLYLAVECLEDSYLLRNFSGQGNLYKPDSMGIRGDGKMNEFVEMEEVFTAPYILQSIEDEESESEQQSSQNSRIAIRGGFAVGGFGMSSGGVTLQYTDDDLDSYYAIFESAKTKSTTKDYARVVTALKNLSESNELEKYVDVEATLRYFAAHTVVVNLDSYVASMCHNYYLYENNGQITILPWDYNLSFGGFMSGNASDVVNFPIDTPVSGVSLEDRPLLGKLLEVDEYMDMYHEYLREIVDGYFNSELYEYTINYLDSLISSYVKNDPSSFYTFEDYEKAVNAMIELGRLRANSIEGQLDGVVPSTSEAQRENPELLVSTENFNFADLGAGAFGGGGVAIGIGGFDFSFDMENVQKATEIISSSDGELTTEQLTELDELGISQEMIEQIQNMNNGRMPRGNNGMFAIPGQRQSPNQMNNSGATQVPQSNTEAPSAQGTSFVANDKIVLGQGAVTLNQTPPQMTIPDGMMIPNEGPFGMPFPNDMENIPLEDFGQMPEDFVFGSTPPAFGQMPEGGQFPEGQVKKAPSEQLQIPDGLMPNQESSAENQTSTGGEITQPEIGEEGFDFQQVSPEELQNLNFEEMTQNSDESEPVSPDEDSMTSESDFNFWNNDPGFDQNKKWGGMADPQSANDQSNSSNRTYNTTLIVISMLLLTGGIIFAATFRRRKLITP